MEFVITNYELRTNGVVLYLFISDGSFKAWLKSKEGEKIKKKDINGDNKVTINHLYLINLSVFNYDGHRS